jgi:hypothetical protein
MRTLTGILLAAAAFAAEPKEIPLYPGAAPGSENDDLRGTGDHRAAGQQVRRISNITHPVLLAYLPESGYQLPGRPGSSLRAAGFDTWPSITREPTWRAG